MSEPKKAYLVSYGCYSDYTVDYIFEDEDTAQRYCNAKNEGRNTDYGFDEHVVEEIWLWPKGAQPTLAKYYAAEAVGLEGEIHVTESNRDVTFEVEKQYAYTQEPKPWTGNEWRFTAHSHDKEWAIKAVADRQYAERLRQLPG